MTRVVLNPRRGGSQVVRARVEDDGAVETGGAAPVVIRDQRFTAPALDELRDVDASNPSDGDVLVFDAETNRYVAEPLGEVTTPDVIDGGTF